MRDCELVEYDNAQPDDFVWLYVAFDPDSLEVYENADQFVAEYVDQAYGKYVRFGFEPMDG